MPLELTQIDWVGGRPAGEIVQDFRLIQPLNIQDADILERDLSEPFCVNLLMANYANRRNRGTFAVSVSTVDVRQVKTVQAAEVLDNQYEKVCFEDLRFHQIYRKPATLEIAGVDGVPGRSVTAWLSSSPIGERVQINGAPTDLTLVHSIVLLKDTEKYQYNAYLLMLFASLLVGLILTAVRNREAI
ncbi:hypothetical protein J2W49_000240 [Hydrogenophaga palleronii]|uniref:Uncharacterized protein n=1 Tax=Hydrogenophaga palleronii TaxID=65655 RepID=A0ABU1WGV0_9BURK|nr:hypothetical protein [Hydrogenophaga palleronii]MDR7148312.1 hypothetical protein [Hydrogenophaga palleronii]